jgi:hypothetical protein
MQLLITSCLMLALAMPALAQNAQDPDKPISFEEQVVVSASRTEEQLINAPAAVSAFRLVQSCRYLGSVLTYHYKHLWPDRHGHRP